MQIVLVTHNYVLISKTSKLVHTAINRTLWPSGYKIHQLIVCEMKILILAFMQKLATSVGVVTSGEEAQAFTCDLTLGESLLTSNLQFC